MVYFCEFIPGLKWNIKYFTCFFQDCLIYSLFSCYFSDHETQRLPAKKTPLTLKEIVILATLWEGGRPQIFQEFYIMFYRFAYYEERTDKVMWNSTVRNAITDGKNQLADKGILSIVKLTDKEKEFIRKNFKKTGGKTVNAYGMF